MKRSMLVMIVIISCLFFINIKILSAKNVKNVNPKEAFEIIKKNSNNKDFVIIDFRPKEKFKKGFIKNAIYYDIDLSGSERWLEKLDREKTYLIYCTKGRRSALALKKMKKMGFMNIFHLNKGLKQWKKAGYKIEVLKEI